jgi:hypothetical protein
MIAKGQTEGAQAARLALGCCPTHGLFMSQYTPYLEKDHALRFGFDGPAESVCIVRCPRKDCEIFALARGPEDIVRVIRPPESATADAYAKRMLHKFHTFLALMQTEEQARRNSGTKLTPDEFEECYALSRRDPS